MGQISEFQIRGNGATWTEPGLHHPQLRAYLAQLGHPHIPNGTTICLPDILCMTYEYAEIIDS